MKAHSGILTIVRLLLAGCLLYLTVLPVALQQQAVMAVAVLTVLLVLLQFPRVGGWRVLFLVFSTFLLLRYLYWRTFFTLDFDDLPSFIASLFLYAAELYGISMFLLSAFVNVRPIRHRIDSAGIREWPVVDVYIPTYDEPLEIVKTTLVAATSLDYPPQLLNVYLLDDGATREKRSAANPLAARFARRRHENMRALCQQLGVHYLTREENSHAKAGNLNAALPKTSGELVVVLDCDHVPTIDFLRETVPPMMKNPRLFLVQTPHFFITPDPFEKNLGLFNRMPSENDMFYGAIQAGLDFWGGSFFCGSAAVLRRQALLDNGGFSGMSVTEDAETALSLHAQGWQSIYMLKPLISGLQPETFSSFIGQRSRWAQGMVQLFLRKNPLRQQGLDWGQKMAYLNCMLFWFFPFARLVFLLAPMCFLLFGLKIYDASIAEIGAYTLPYLVALVLTASYLFGRVRWFLISEIYESMQSFFSLKAVISTIRYPDRPEFVVTRKGERRDADFISPLVAPFYLLLLVIVLGFAATVWRWGMYPDQRSLILITSLWNVFGFLIVIASLGALYERRQRRSQPRLPADDLLAELIVDGKAVAVCFEDISTGGAAIRCSEIVAVRNGKAILELQHPLLDKTCRFDVDIVGEYTTVKGVFLGIRFLPDSLDTYREITLLVHGDSARWQRMLDRRETDIGILPAAGLLLACGFRQAWSHVLAVLDFITIQIKSDKHGVESTFVLADGDLDPVPLPAQPGGGKQDYPTE